MPRGRVRQTPAAAWRDSERRILENLPIPADATGFNELLRRTKLSPTTLSAHLTRLVAEGKAVRDIRTRRYARTEAGERWLDVDARLQEIADNANRFGLVGPARQGGAASESLRWIGARTEPEAAAGSSRRKRRLALADQTALYAMPSPGPSALSALANALPAVIAEMVLADRMRRDLPPAPTGSRPPAVHPTRNAIRGLPRLLIVKIDWDSAAAILDVESNRRLWRRILVRVETTERKKRRVSTRPGKA